MHITLKREGRDDLECVLPFGQAEHVNVKVPCACGNNGIRGAGLQVERTEYVLSRGAICTSCGECRGILHVELSTLFGVSEDERVVMGPCKVY